MPPANTVPEVNDAMRAAAKLWVVAVFVVKGAELLSYAILLRHVIVSRGADLRVYAAWFLATRFSGLAANQFCQCQIGKIVNSPVSLRTLLGNMITPLLISLTVFYLIWSAAR
jgi:hypothetical protein